MTDKLTFERENRERIQAVETSFGPSGKPLYQQGRILMGEGCLLKQGRRKREQKAFFLFNDVLVYGSKILKSRWHKNQKILPLENIMLEDIEDNEALRNQWLIRTPSKSFFVSALSHEEKQAWMEHINECRERLLQGGSLQPGSNFAVSWIPDQNSYKCMRCLHNFSVTRRRHHCRKCGFLVCNSCSSQREVIDHIHPTKRLRVCSHCYKQKEEETTRLRGDSAGNSFEDDDLAPSSDEEEEEKEETMQFHAPSNWLEFRTGTWGHMNSYINSGPKPHRPYTSIM